MSSETSDFVRADRAFFGHPRGLGILAATEVWVAFSYYGMQSLLVLYMTGYLLRPGHIEHILGFTQFRAFLAPLYGHVGGEALASAITGLYGALAFGTPLIGGLIADRWIGRTRSIIAGSVLMTLGHFLMAFDVSFLLALLCIVAGTGLAGVMKAQVGGLYSTQDMRRADAFQIYVLVVQLAVIVAPIVCGGLGEKVAWHVGFGAAGVGMAIGLITYLAGRRWLPPDPKAKGAARSEHPPMTARDWRTTGVLALLVPIFALSFVGNNEIFNAYLLWGRDHYQLEFFGQTMPVSWLISLDAFVASGAIVVVVIFWRWWARRWREPDEIVKAGIGALIAAGGPLVLAAASLQAVGGHRVGLVWGLGFHIVNDIGFSMLYPVGLALFSRAAPPALGATVVNSFTFAVFLSNLAVGRLAGLLGEMPGSTFWTLHAALVAIAGLLLLACGWLFRRTLAPGSREPGPPTGVSADTAADP
jgi:POT family proton-dependent oligopeptide transporter